MSNSQSRTVVPAVALSVTGNHNMYAVRADRFVTRIKRNTSTIPPYRPVSLFRSLHDQLKPTHGMDSDQHMHISLLLFKALV